MNKIEEHGKVAVLYSPGYGAGWSSWSGDHEIAKAMCMDARIVSAFLSGGYQSAEKAALELFPDIYTGGAKDLKVEWIEKGMQFEIQEYDGSEGIHVIGSQQYFVA